MKTISKMETPHVVQWNSKGEWVTTACFVEREDAQIYLKDKELEFPTDEFRIVRLPVFIGDD